MNGECSISLLPASQSMAGMLGPGPNTATEFVNFSSDLFVSETLV